jgi:hypothetical protein
MRRRRRKRGYRRCLGRKKNYNYNSSESYEFEPVLFYDVKHLGFNPMHKRIRVVENFAHICENK